MKKLYCLVQEKLADKKAIVVGISGISLSGKTTIANQLKSLCEIEHSVYIISLSENVSIYQQSLKTVNPSKYYYENVYDFEALKQEVLEAIKIYEIVIIEGPLLFKHTVTIPYDLKIWVDCTFTTSIMRSPESTKALYEDYFMWVQRQHFSIDGPKVQADYIMRNDEILEVPNEILIDLTQDEKSIQKMKWFNKPQKYILGDKMLYVETDAKTDFWQRTHYGFRNDNAHMLYVETSHDFTMITKVKFNPVHQFDQCGLAIRIDEDNWLKTSIEYELESHAKLSVVATNLGYSDWSIQELDEKVNEASFRITREGQDYKVEVDICDRGWQLLRICHLHHRNKSVKCGIYCCSPIEAGYHAIFEELKIIKNYC